MRSAYPQQKKNPIPTHTIAQMIRRRSSSRCSISDIDLICSRREGGGVDEEFSSSTSGMSFLGGAIAVDRRLCRDLAGGGHCAHRGGGGGVYDVGFFRRQNFIAFFFQAANFALDLGGELIFGTLEFGQRFTDLPADLRQLARTKQQ